MTEEERRIISDYVMRVAGAQPAAAAASPSAGPWGGRPTTGQAPAAPPLPPVEPEADRLIADLFQRYPEARFRITQTAFVQEHALVAANNRIQELEYQLEATRRQAQAAQSKGLFGFGGSKPAPMPPPPQPQYPPNYNPQALQGARARASSHAMMTACGAWPAHGARNMLMGAPAAGRPAGHGAGRRRRRLRPGGRPDLLALDRPRPAAANAGYGCNASGTTTTRRLRRRGSYDTAGYDDGSGSRRRRWLRRPRLSHTGPARQTARPDLPLASRRAGLQPRPPRQDWPRLAGRITAACASPTSTSTCCAASSPWPSAAASPRPARRSASPNRPSASR
jgi:hypothetical protein